jgi:hypothetical protein
MTQNVVRSTSLRSFHPDVPDAGDGVDERVMLSRFRRTMGADNPRAQYRGTPDEMARSYSN